MYKIGHREKKIRHHLGAVVVLLVITFGIIATVFWYFGLRADKTSIKQANVGSQVFDPNNSKNNIKIDTALYTVELPSDWKKIAENRDTRYTSVQWQMQSGIKNRWIEIYTDRLPDDLSFNKIIPVSVSSNRIVSEAVSENCVKFTPSAGNTLKVSSKWQDAPFLCDMSNKTDNIIGVSEKNVGPVFTLTGPKQGTHKYEFVYTDRGIPEDENPIIVALDSLTPK